MNFRDADYYYDTGLPQSHGLVLAASYCPSVLGTKRPYRAECLLADVAVERRLRPLPHPNCADFNHWRYGLAGAPRYVDNRFERGKNYIAYLHPRHPRGTAQDYAFVCGVGHDNRRMFNSACGIGAIFNRPESACAAQGKI